MVTKFFFSPVSHLRLWFLFDFLRENLFPVTPLAWFLCVARLLLGMGSWERGALWCCDWALDSCGAPVLWVWPSEALHPLLHPAVVLAWAFLLTLLQGWLSSLPVSSLLATFSPSALDGDFCFFSHWRFKHCSLPGGRGMNVDRVLTGLLDPLQPAPCENFVRVPLIFLLNTQRFHEGKACKRVQLPLPTPISDPQRSHLHTLVSTWLLAARWSLSASREASAPVPVLLQALSSPGFQAAGCPTCLRGSIGSGEPTG